MNCNSENRTQIVEFLEYIKDKENLNLETASEYLLTATWLLPTGY